jgi:hypothetical protein
MSAKPGKGFIQHGDHWPSPYYLFVEPGRAGGIVRNKRKSIDAYEVKTRHFGDELVEFLNYAYAEGYGQAQEDCPSGGWDGP